ncbi:MAG TPA: pentapeptide repeat-containing protein [Nitrososphaeraceae archaeon]|nr:pentapeptide repeat-containing protein [Nitrososphaeraceae archaeon]
MPDWPHIFQCEEEASIGKFCFFHDEYYLKNRSKVPDAFSNRLKQKIEESTSQKKPLLCIGYHIPDIRIENRYFIAGIYFTKSTFHGKTVFNNTFFQNADFSDAEFQEVTFNSGNFFKDAFLSVLSSTRKPSSV